MKTRKIFQCALLLALLLPLVACSSGDFDSGMNDLPFYESGSAVNPVRISWGVYEARWLVDGQSLGDCQLQVWNQFNVELPAVYLLEQVLTYNGIAINGGDGDKEVSYESNRDLGYQITAYTGDGQKNYYYNVRATRYQFGFRRDGHTWHCQVCLTPERSVAVFDSGAMQWTAMLSVDSLVVRDQRDEVQARRAYGEPLQLTLQTIRKIGDI